MSEEHEIQFGTLNPDGKLTNVRMIKQSDIQKCPFYILVPSHYREDGTCKCNDPEERKMMIREWGYKESDSTGWEFLKGDLTAGLARTIESGSTTGRILAKMHGIKLKD